MYPMTSPSLLHKDQARKSFRTYYWAFQWSNFLHIWSYPAEITRKNKSISLPTRTVQPLRSLNQVFEHLPSFFGCHHLSEFRCQRNGTWLRLIRSRKGLYYRGTSRNWSNNVQENPDLFMLFNTWEEARYLGVLSMANAVFISQELFHPRVTTTVTKLDKFTCGFDVLSTPLYACSCFIVFPAELFFPSYDVYWSELRHCDIWHYSPNRCHE